jgi:sec-independent protein translocase protein TatA
MAFGFGLGPFEIALIVGVLLLLFGAKRLPELASGMGKSIRDFKRAINGLDEKSIEASIAEQSPLPTQQAQQQIPPREGQ